MKDIFSSYHKHKVLSHVSLIALSAIFAIGINVLLVQTPATQMLQANILWSETVEENSTDFSGFIRGKEIIFQTHEAMQEVQELSFSLAYDPQVLKLWAYTTSLEASTIDELKNEDGFVTYIIRFETPITLSSPNEIPNLSFEKAQQKTVFLNPVQVNFKDKNSEMFLLSSSQLQF